MASFSMNYKELLRKVDEEISFCKKLIAGDVVVTNDAVLFSFFSNDKEYLKKYLKELERYRFSIINNPIYNEGRIDIDCQR